MGKYINKVTILGNVGGEPHITTLQDNTMVAQMNVATSTGGYTKHDGTEVPQKTTWHRIVLWRGLAKAVNDYVRKGARVMVEGSLEYRKYTDRNNVEREVAEIVATDLFLMDKPQGTQQPPAPSQAPFQEPQSLGQPDDDVPF